VTTTWVGLTDVTVAGVPPNVAVVDPFTSPAPVIVTVVPPAVGPVVTSKPTIAGTAGGRGRYTKPPVTVALPPGVVTVTSTVPTVWAGEVTTARVPSLLTDVTVAGVPPKVTDVAPGMRSVPVIVTDVPPLTRPLAMSRLDTVGATAVGTLQALRATSRLSTSVSTVGNAKPCTVKWALTCSAVTDAEVELVVVGCDTVTVSVASETPGTASVTGVLRVTDPALTSTVWPSTLRPTTCAEVVGLLPVPTVGHCTDELTALAATTDNPSNETARTVACA
jgi:hypothetical protein